MTGIALWFLLSGTGWAQRPTNSPKQKDRFSPLFHSLEEAKAFADIAAKSDYQEFLLQRNTDTIADGQSPRGFLGIDDPAFPAGTALVVLSACYTGVYTTQETRLTNMRLIHFATHGFLTGSQAQEASVKAVGFNPTILRSRLERDYLNKRISELEYEAKSIEIELYADEVYSRAAQAYLTALHLTQSCQNNTIRRDHHQRDLQDTFYDRLQLELDLIRKVISEAEYHERKQRLSEEERSIGRQNRHDPFDIAQYYERASWMRTEVGRKRRSLSDILLPWAPIAVALLALISTFYISFRKDNREGLALDLQEQDMSLRQIQASETIEKTKLLLEMKGLQLREMELKVQQLEYQIAANSTSQ